MNGYAEAMNRETKRRVELAVALATVARAPLPAELADGQPLAPPAPQDLGKDLAEVAAEAQGDAGRRDGASDGAAQRQPAEARNRRAARPRPRQ